MQFFIRRTFIVSIVFVLSSTLLTNLSLANTEEFVNSIYSGNVPFLVVSKSTIDPSKREPGIYILDEKRNWQMIIPGEPYRDKNTCGIIGQLSMHKITRRNEAIALVDGRIVIFHINSNKKNSNSVLTLGDNLPIFDPITRNQVTVPPLDYKNLSLKVAETKPAGTQMLFVSIPGNHQLKTKALTFVVFIKPTKGKDISVPFGGMVLDYRYYSAKDLDRFWIGAPGPNVIVPVQLDAILNSPLTERTTARLDWEKKVKVVLDHVRSGTNSSDLSAAERTTPYFTFKGDKENAWTVDEIHELVIHEDALTMSLDYDPGISRSSVSVRYGSDILTLPGAPDPMPSGRAAKKSKPYAIWDQGHLNKNWEHGEDTLIASMNDGQIVMFAPSLKGLPVSTNLMQTKVTPQDLVSLSLPRLKESNGDVVFYTLASFKLGGKRDGTYLFKILCTRTGISKVGELKIADRYIEEDELRKRLKFAGNPTSPTILFNNENRLTSVRGKDTRPFINLIPSLRKHTEIVSFSAPLVAESLDFGSLRFLEFKDKGFKNPWTGIYWGPIHKQPKNWPIHATPLTTQSADGVSLLDRRVFPVNDTSLTATVAIMAMDESSKSGKNGFQLLMMSPPGEIDGEVQDSEETSEIRSGNNDEDDDDDDDDVIADDLSGDALNFSVINFDFPFPNLKSVILIPFSDEYKSNYALLVKFKEGGETKLWLGTYVVGLDPNNKKPKISPLRDAAVVKSHKLSGLDTDDFTRRIYYSKDGRPHLVATPDFDHNDPRFTMIDLHNGKEISPNSSGRGMNSYTSYSQKNGNDADHLSFHSPGSWLAFSMSSLQTRLGEAIGHKDYQFQKRIKASTQRQYRALQPAMDGMFGKNRKPKHIIYIVSEHLKPNFYNMMGSLLDREGGTKFSVRNFDFDPYIITQSLGSVREVSDNFTAISKRSNANFVLADGAALEVIGTPNNDDEDKDLALDVNIDGRQIKADPHILYWLGTEGKLTPPSKLKGAAKTTYQVPTVAVCTPQQFENLRSQLSVAGQEDVLNEFEIDETYSASDWRIWHPDAEGTSKEIQTHHRRHMSSAEASILPNLLPEARKLADIAQKPKLKVLLTDEKLMPFVRKTLLARWATVQGETDRDTWSAYNESLLFHEITSSKASGRIKVKGKSKSKKDDDDEDEEDEVDDKPTLDQTTQSSMMSNLQASHSRLPEGQRSVLFSELATLIKLGRPAAAHGEKEHLLTDPADSSNEGSQLPHVLYLLSTNGKPLTARQYASRNHTLPEDSYSALLVGTPQQWESLKRDAQFEQRFGILSDYEVEYIQSPTHETKVALVSRVFDTPGIKGLNFNFLLEDNSTDLDSEARRRQVVEYIVNRSENVATQYGQEPTNALLRTINEFQEMLISDPAIRQARVINRKFMERVISKVFGLPLNFAILPENDPLRILKNELKAALTMQYAGYEGPLDLKLTLIETVLAQTRNSQAIKIPSSILVYGDSSTGKTFLFEVLFKMLGLKVYDFKPGAVNDDAMAIVINCGKISESGSSESPDAMTADEAIRHVNEFLAGPMGYRGFLLFDDIHKAPPNERMKLLAFINSLNEATGGIAKVRDKSGMIKEVPVKNLTLGVTLNPTPNQDKIDRYAPNGTDEEMIAASLTCSDDAPVEVSFLKRFGAVINLSQFPVSAKAPKLNETLRDGSRNTFNAQGQFLLMSPTAIAGIVGTFKNANAREFLNEAVQRYLDVINRMGIENRGTFILSAPEADLSSGRPRPRPKPSLDDDEDSFVAQGRVSSEIHKYISEHTVAHSVNGSMEGKIQFLEIIFDTFRTLFHEGLVNNLSADPDLATNHAHGERFLAPFLHAVTDNLALTPFIPLKYLNAYPHELGFAKIIDAQEFSSRIENRYAVERKIFPVKFSDEIGQPHSLLQALDPNKIVRLSKTRVDILTEYSQKLVAPLSELLMVAGRLGSVPPNPGVEHWIRNLTTTDPKEEFAQIFKEIRVLFEGFKHDFLAVDVVGNQSSPINLYDLARLFMIASDRAATRLPWGRTVQFYAQAMDTLSKRTELSQHPGVQHYLFKSRLALLRTASHELTPTIAGANRPYQAWRTKGTDKMNRQAFPSRCDAIFKRNDQDAKDAN